MYSSVNTLAHKFNIYPLLNNIVFFTKKIFIKKTSYPIISIILFIVVLILNIIQYSNNDSNSNNDKNYLQSKIIEKRYNDNKNLKNVYLKNYILYFYDVIGINAFLYNGLLHIFYLILAYILLALIEMNIGHIPLLFLLFIIILFSTTYMRGIVNSICENSYFIDNLLISPYCCGSQILFTSLGFVLYLIQHNIIQMNNYILMLFIILLAWIGIILFDYYTEFKKKTKEEDTKICYSLNWHASLLIFGILCGVAIGN
jgi:hypothetical protein